MPPIQPFPKHRLCVSGQPPGRPRDIRGSTFKALPMIVTDVEKKTNISGSRKREWIPIAGWMKKLGSHFFLGVSVCFFFEVSALSKYITVPNMCLVYMFLFLG